MGFLDVHETLMRYLKVQSELSSDQGFLLVVLYISGIILPSCKLNCNTPLQGSLELFSLMECPQICLYIYIHFRLTRWCLFFQSRCLT